ncbi:hypothetical protein CAPTEDRAFT_179520 [Capitella teleta]|uniref:Elongation factor 1-beta n=1 Tax=Capitella teleta TaxID=283909 RepID=R7V379_CAPTE|nr:hypothetical protein CAPTEDRAFT_179520 [Capitella teleta]|eukprot:ELU13298.1 hypothetical protein CAPTEDRAFT_179520 [Capitella teleta]
MGFGDLKSNAGLKVLNEFLADKSFIQGFVPSQADVAVFEAMSGAPAESFVNALRWYNQIKSYGSQKSSLPGVKGTVDSYGPAGAAPAASKDDDDDDFDLFGEDEDEEDEEEAQRIKDERIAAYQAKKSKKPALIAKSNVILDVKPWSDETDHAEMEKCVRSIEMDGLLWGASKLVPVGYGIKKLQIATVIEDDKVSTDDLIEQICEFEDHVQSVDIAAFNKI